MGLATVSDISGPVREVAPRRVSAAIGRGLEAVLMTVFAVIGWLAGALWRVLVSSALSLEYGFRAGAGWPQREPGSAEPPAEG